MHESVQEKDTYAKVAGFLVVVMALLSPLLAWYGEDDIPKHLQDRHVQILVP